MSFSKHNDVIMNTYTQGRLLCNVKRRNNIYIKMFQYFAILLYVLNLMTRSVVHFN